MLLFKQEQHDLYYFNAHYYNPTIARFINVDPVQSGQNWYVYCSNPLSFVDPTGLEDENLNLDPDPAADNPTQQGQESQYTYINPLKQNEKLPDYANECKKFSITNEVIAQERVKKEVTQESLMKELKNIRYSTSEIEKKINSILFDKEVNLKDLNSEEAKKYLNKVSKNIKIVLKFNQKDYWDNSDDVNYHFVGYRGRGDATDDIKTFDPWNIKTYMNRAQKKEIRSGVKIEIKNKKE